MRGILEMLLPKSIKKAVKRIAFCFIDRDKIYFVSFPDKVIKEFNFPRTAVSDADVLNKEEYRFAVFEWVREANLKISDILFVVSENLIFVKDFHADRRMKSPPQDTLNEFVEVVPFQRVFISKIVSKDGGVKMIVTNRDIVSVVVRAFEAVGFVSVGIFPEFAVITDSTDTIDFGDLLDQARKHLDLYTLHPYTQHAFQTNRDLSVKPISQMSVGEAAQQPINPLVAVAIVLVMIGATLFFTYWRYEQMRVSEMMATQKRIEAFAAKQAASLPPTQNSGPMPVSAQVTPVLPSSVQSPQQQPISKVKIQIVYANTSTRIFDLIKASLAATYGYEVVGEVSANDSATTRLIVGEKTQDQTVRAINTVLDSIKISAQTTTGANIEGYDAVLTIGKTAPEAPVVSP